MNNESAIQTSPKPTQRPGGISSSNTMIPSRNWRTGARYCSSPRDTIETRVAANPKQISGIAVTTPADISSSACPTPSLEKCEPPVAESQIR